MVSTTKHDKTEKLGITLPISLLKQIENKRGDIPRSTFIRRAVESYLNEAKGDQSCLIFSEDLQHPSSINN